VTQPSDPILITSIGTVEHRERALRLSGPDALLCAGVLAARLGKHTGHPLGSCWPDFYAQQIRATATHYAAHPSGDALYTLHLCIAACETFFDNNPFHPQPPLSGGLPPR
jgi:hypothetical protein